MPSVNKDGLSPGQPVDFATIQKTEHERKIKSKKPIRQKKVKANDE